MMHAVMQVVGDDLLPASLWLVMFTMGLSLVLDDFRAIAANSRAFLVGSGSMLVLVPLVGTAMALRFGPTPALTVGLILLATCPGGMLSNLLTDLAKGDLALSVSMSLVVSVIYIFTLPVISLYAVRYVLAGGATVAIPVLSSLGHIVAITVFPIAVGMAARRLWPRFALGWGGYIKAGATLALVVMFGLIIVEQYDTLRSAFGVVMGVVVAMNGANFLIAVGVSRLARLKPPERISVTIEHLIRQEATAVYVAVTLLHRNDMSLPMICNTFIGMAGCLVFVAVATRRRQREAALAGVPSAKG